MNLAISFSDQSPSFAHGVEFGRLLEKMQRGDPFASNNAFPVRVENETVIRDCCKRYGYMPAFSNCSVEGWVEFSATKISTDLN